MQIISFAWTTPALLAGAKTVTRREWSLNYAARFHKGDLMAAYDRSPRFKGKQVATIYLTASPYLERVGNAPASAYQDEGLEWMEKQRININGCEPREFWRRWQMENPLVWVIRFQLSPLLPQSPE